MAQHHFRNDYHTQFDVDEYLSAYYKPIGNSKGEAKLLPFFLSEYYSFFQKFQEERREEEEEEEKEEKGVVVDILDFGSGPSPWHAGAMFSMERVSIRLVLSDYSLANQKALLDWKKGSFSHDWVSFYLSAASKNESQFFDERDQNEKLLSPSSPPPSSPSSSSSSSSSSLPSSPPLLQSERETKMKERVEKARSSIQSVISCDALSSPPFPPEASLSLSSFHLITTNLCLEAACETKEQYRNAVFQLSKYLRKGGWFVQSVVLGEHYYSVGEKKFHCLSLSKDDVIGAMQDADLQVCIFSLSDAQAEEAVADFDGLAFIAGQKKKVIFQNIFLLYHRIFISSNKSQKIEINNLISSQKIRNIWKIEKLFQRKTAPRVSQTPNYEKKSKSLFIHISNNKTNQKKTKSYFMK